MSEGDGDETVQYEIQILYKKIIKKKQRTEKTLKKNKLLIPKIEMYIVLS